MAVTCLIPVARSGHRGMPGLGRSSCGGCQRREAKRTVVRQWMRPLSGPCTLTPALPLLRCTTGQEIHGCTPGVQWNLC